MTRSDTESQTIVCWRSLIYSTLSHHCAFLSDLLPGFEQKMPSTRSQNQPTLQFPRRKSSRLGSRPKSSSENAVDVQTTPLSPRKTNMGDSLGVCLSPRKSVLKSTSLSERLPLSPRKRTGV